MYKDKDKKRDKDRDRQRRYRASKGVTSQGVTKGVTSEAPTSDVRPEVKPINSKVPTPDKQLITLHPAIIAGIIRLSTNPDGTVDDEERSRRIAIATNYERLHPGRPYTGIGIAPGDIPANPQPVSVSLPGDAEYVPIPDVDVAVEVSYQRQLKQMPPTQSHNPEYHYMVNELKRTAPEQSHNPMMIGYVPPTDK